MDAILQFLSINSLQACDEEAWRLGSPDMKGRHASCTSLGDALKLAGVKPVQNEEAENTYGDMSSSDALRQLYVEMRQMRSTKLSYWHVMLSAEAARGGQQAVLRTDEERRFATRLIKYIGKSLVENGRDMPGSKNLMLALLCWAKDPSVRECICQILFQALNHGHITASLIGEGSFDRLPRRIIENFHSDTNLWGRWQDELYGREKERQEKIEEERITREAEREARDNALDNATKLREELQRAFMQIRAEPERTTPCPDTDDLLLVARWSNIRSAPVTITDGSIRDIINSDYEFSKNYSARAAELAAIAYYKALEADVADIAITQLEDSSNDWKTHDLLVNGRPIDVKSARQSSSRPDRYSGFLVPKFKSERKNNDEVTITAVLNSPYRSAQSILEGTSASSLILGEAKASELRRISGWIDVVTNGTFESQGFGNYEKLPGWCFDYDWDPELINRQLSERYGELLDLMETDRWLAEKVTVPRALKVRLAISGSPDQYFSIESEIATDKDSHDVLVALKSLASKVGLSRPAIFLFVITYTLSKLSDAATAWSPIKLQEYIFWTDHHDGARWPLGVYDPLKFVYEIMNGMNRLWLKARRELEEFKSFYLAGPSILIGTHIGGQKRTLIAYCGGWREVGKTRMPCGETTLILGQNLNCKRCGKLICHSCEYCSEECDRGGYRANSEYLGSE